MHNANGVRDCRELLKISQQRKISQTERFRAKNALNVWKHICVREYIFTMKKVKSKNRNRMADGTLDDTTNTGFDKGMIVSEKPRPQASR